MESFYLDGAKELITQILEGNYSDEKWLDIECKAKFLFDIAPLELHGVIQNMFIESGAGEMLYMVCSGIKFMWQSEG